MIIIALTMDYYIIIDRYKHKKSRARPSDRNGCLRLLFRGVSRAPSVWGAGGGPKGPAVESAAGWCYYAVHLFFGEFFTISG